MLDGIKINSFQAHDESELEFGPGVNIITGASDAGKTAIVRALNWIVNNRPLGDGFINDNKEETCVDLVFDRQGDHCKVQRRRSRKQINEYVVDEVGHNGPQDPLPIQHVMKAFGSNVPEEVSDLLNLSDVNIQHQFSPYFLVLDPPGQIALYIRKIAKLYEIDETVAVLASEIRDCDKQRSNLNTELVTVEEKLVKLSEVDLDKLEKLIDECKLKEQEKGQISLQAAGIESITTELKQLELDMVCLPDSIDLQAKIGFIEIALERYLTLVDECTNLNAVITQLKEIESIKINLPEDIGTEISSIENIISTYNNIGQKFVNLSELIDSFEKIDSQLIKIDSDLVKGNTKKEEMLKQLIDCPSCGVPLTPGSRKQLIGE